MRGVGLSAHLDFSVNSRFDSVQPITPNVQEHSGSRMWGKLHVIRSFFGLAEIGRVRGK
jgi:hypothetical protein